MNEIIFTTFSKDEIRTLIENAVKNALDQKIIIDHDNVDSILDTDQAAAFIGIAKPTLYAKCSEKHIPHFKKGRKLYFDKKELIEWLKSGKRKTIDDIHASVNASLGKRRV
jgi:excisionase family DNA binding protein